MKSARPDLPWSAEATALEVKKRDEVEEALLTCCGNVSSTAVLLGIGRSSVIKMLKRFDLVDRARELRTATGARPTGRPRK